MSLSPTMRQAALQLVRSGRIEQLRRLADAGDPQGRRRLAVWLARTGEIGELRIRVAGGDRHARRQLADWLVRQGRRDEATAELRSLTAGGDQAAGRELTEVPRRERPARELRSLDHVVGGHIRAVAFSPDGSMLATCGNAYTILVWHPLTGEHLRTLRSPGAVSAIAFSPDSAVLAGNGAAGGGAQLWNPRTGEHLNGVRLWNPTTGKLVAHLDTEANALAFSPDGTFLATADDAEGVVRLWDITNGR